MAPSATSLPLSLILGAVGLFLIIWILADLRGRRRGAPARVKAGGSAAGQAERDVLRANHAVEVAELERKLAEAEARTQKDRDASLRLKETEARLEAAATGGKAGEAALAAADAKITALNEEIATLKAGSGASESLVSERDAARAEAARLSDELETLRRSLHESGDKLAHATAKAEEDAATIERLTGERTDALAAAERERTLAGDLRREAEALRQRLAEKPEAAGAPALEATVAQLTEREAKATKVAEEHAATIAELRAALADARTTGAKSAEADVTELRNQLATLETREHTANETLSRLSYEHDGLKNRLATAERLEREARAKAEKDETLLELRQQKIYALEARLREEHQQRQAAQKQATSLGNAQAAGTDGEARARIEALQSALEEANEETQRLHTELDGLRAATPPGQSYEEAREIAEALSAAQAEAEELRSEVQRLETLARDVPQAQPDVAALREAIRVLAQRFMDDADPLAEAAAREPSLAERIRAFKATRDASVRRPLRIAAPKER